MFQRRGGRKAMAFPAGKRMSEPCKEPHETRRQEFEATVLVHLDALYNLALRMTREPFSAEDLVQDTMVRAYRFFGRYKRDSNCRAWLFAIMKNAYINRYRKTAREAHTVSLDAIEEHSGSSLLATLPAKTRSPEAATDDGRLAAVLRGALDALPADFRMAAVLAIVEECSYKEIAAIMSCPIGTVMSRVHRARQMLQAALREHANDRGLPGRGSDTSSPVMAALPLAAAGAAMTSRSLPLAVL
jgi:RNA polymerase sigma-70 factor, ECF subfamily